MCMIDYGDRPSVYRAKMQRSRKERRCEECGRKIAIGERYQSVFGVCGDGQFTAQTCEHCLVAMSWLSVNCGGYMHQAVWEDLEEHITEYPTLAYSLLRLSVARRRQWERFDQSGLMPIPKVPPSLEEVGLERHQ